MHLAKIRTYLGTQVVCSYRGLWELPGVPPNGVTPSLQVQGKRRPSAKLHGILFSFSQPFCSAVRSGL